MAKTEVAEAKGTAVGALGMFEAHAGSGMENVTKNDLLVPRLAILQALSPQLKKSKPEYVEGASAGDICDVGLSELFDAPLKFLPVYFNKVWIEWAPRESDGGLVEIHDTDAIMAKAEKNDRGQYVLPNKNYVVETAQMFGFNLSADRRRCFISFASTQLKKARKWNTMAMSEKLKRGDGSEFTPPLFFRTYNLGVAEESNNQGDWFGWTVNRGETLEELGDGWQNIFQDAIDFSQQIKAGEAKADNSDIADGGGAEGGAGGGAEGAM